MSLQELKARIELKDDKYLTKTAATDVNRRRFPGKNRDQQNWKPY
jgi:hypothetical protein